MASGFPTFQFNPATNRFDPVFPQAVTPQNVQLNTQPINPSAGNGFDSRVLLQILNGLSQNFNPQNQRQQQVPPTGGLGAPPLPIANRNVQPGPIPRVPNPRIIP